MECHIIYYVFEKIHLYFVKFSRISTVYYYWVSSNSSYKIVTFRDIKLSGMSKKLQPLSTFVRNKKVYIVACAD